MPDGIVNLLAELAEVKTSKEYAEMVLVSQQKTDEVKELKRKRDHARLALKRGKMEHQCNPASRLAQLYSSGALLAEQEKTQVAYGRCAQAGVAHFMGPRMGE